MGASSNTLAKEKEMKLVRTIKLHGELQSFGKTKSFAGGTLPQVLDGLFALNKGLKQAIEKGAWNIVVNGQNWKTIDVTKKLDDDELEIHILPHLEGAGWGSVFKIIGVILIAAAIYWSGGTLAGLGSSAYGFTAGSVLLLGVSLFWTGYQMSQMESLDQADEAPSYMFNGPVNTQVQGGPVPLVLGRFKTGSTVINAGVTTERLGDNPGWVAASTVIGNTGSITTIK